MSKKCGVVALLGLTNSGKSTLLNQLIGQKLAITSPTPQTTRFLLKGILTKPNWQAVFLDTPGLHEPQKLYQQSMLKETERSLLMADLYLYLSTPENKDLEQEKAFLIKLVEHPQPKILLMNKSDKFPLDSSQAKAVGLSALCPFQQILHTSAQDPTRLEELLQVLPNFLPDSDYLFSEDTVTDQSERAICAELVREAMIEECFQEIPYGVVAEIEDFQDLPKLARIRANIFVEKPSHQAIVVGVGGNKAKRIATQARLGMEELLGKKVYLELKVKLLKNWTTNPNMLQKLGFTVDAKAQASQKKGGSGRYLQSP